MSELTHVLVETLSCGNMIVPVDKISLHKVGDKCLVMVHNDVEWREISLSQYRCIKGILAYG